MAITVGLTGTAEMEVTVEMTARHLGSGDVDVLGTPALIALCEAATISAISNHLDPGAATVGSRIEFDHVAPTPVGRRVVATARLDSVDDRFLTFGVSAESRGQPLGSGVVTRVVVDAERFHRRAVAE